MILHGSPLLEAPPAKPGRDPMTAAAGWFPWATSAPLSLGLNGVWRRLGGALPICMGRRQGGVEVFGGGLARGDDDEDVQERGGDGALTAGAGVPDLGAVGLWIAFMSVFVSVVQHLPLVAGAAVLDGASAVFRWWCRSE